MTVLPTGGREARRCGGVRVRRVTGPLIGRPGLAAGVTMAGRVSLTSGQGGFDLCRSAIAAARLLSTLLGTGRPSDCLQRAKNGTNRRFHHWRRFTGMDDGRAASHACRGSGSRNESMATGRAILSSDRCFPRNYVAIKTI